jgi:rod shape-determining protein MreD
VDVAKPDPVLVLVVALAFQPDAVAVWSVFALGCLADALSGAPAGLGACLYLPVYGLTRVALRFLVPGRRSVQVGAVFFASLLAAALLVLLARLLGAGDALPADLGLWAAPVGLWNGLLALLLWPVTQRLLGPAEVPGRLGAA